MMTIRPLEDQFEPKKVAEIQNLAKKYANLRLNLKGDSAGYMISGITRCLETGIILGALSLAFSFLDMFVHDLALLKGKGKDVDGNHHDGPESLFMSRQNQLPFESHMSEFIYEGMIEENDGKEILLIYRKIGIPLHHILSRHIGRYSRPLILGPGNLLDRFLARNIKDVHQIEAMIEDYATESLKLIVSFIAKYQEIFSTESQV